MTDVELKERINYIRMIAEDFKQVSEEISNHDTALKYVSMSIGLLKALDILAGGSRDKADLELVE